MKRLTTIILSSCLFPAFAHAESVVIVSSDNSSNKSKPYYHFMGFYDYRFSHSEGLQSGSSRIDVQDTLSPVGGYTLAPQKLDSSEHVFGLTFGIKDDFILLMGLPYAAKEMTVRNKDVGVDRTYSTKSSGIGDAAIAGIFNLIDDSDSNLFFGFGLSLPTGSIDKTANTPINAAHPLPFDMQLGTGSFALTPTVFYNAKSDIFDCGFRATPVFYLNRNDNGYKYGNVYSFEVYGECHLTEWLDFKVALDSKISEKIDGRDKRTASFNDLSHDPGNTGGYNLDCEFTLLFVKMVHLKFALPAYQKSNGIQLERQWEIGLSVICPLYIGN